MSEKTKDGVSVSRAEELLYGHFASIVRTAGMAATAAERSMNETAERLTECRRDDGCTSGPRDEEGRSPMTAWLEVMFEQAHRSFEAARLWYETAATECQRQYAEWKRPEPPMTVVGGRIADLSEEAFAPHYESLRQGAEIVYGSRNAEFVLLRIFFDDEGRGVLSGIISRDQLVFDSVLVGDGLWEMRVPVDVAKAQCSPIPSSFDVRSSTGDVWASPGGTETND